MRKRFILCILFVVSLNVYSQVYDPYHFGLIFNASFQKIKIDSLIITSYQTPTKMDSLALTSNQIPNLDFPVGKLAMYFNKQGKIERLEEYQYDYEKDKGWYSRMTAKKLYIYNDKDYLVRQEHYDIWRTDSGLYFENYFYDSSIKLCKSIYVCQGSSSCLGEGVQNVTYYYYSNTNQLTSQKEYDYYPIFTRTLKFDYDLKNRLVKYNVFYNDTNSVPTEWKYTEDKFNHLVKTYRIDYVDKDFPWKQEFFYDDRGLVILSKHGNGKLDKYQYHYQK